MADTDSRWTANGRSNTLTLGYLAWNVTATSQLPREVNKFLPTYVTLFKPVNFRQYFVWLRERIFNCYKIL